MMLIHFPAFQHNMTSLMKSGSGLVKLMMKTNNSSVMSGGYQWHVTDTFREPADVCQKIMTHETPELLKSFSLISLRGSLLQHCLSIITWL